MIERCMLLNCYKVTDFKGEERIFTCRTLDDYKYLDLFEARWGKGNRNNDPDNPRIPKIGDKIRIDVDCFSRFGSYANGADAIVTGLGKNPKDGFYNVRLSKEYMVKHFGEELPEKYQDLVIRAVDIQWYYNT